VEREEMFVPYSLFVKLDIDNEFEIVVPSKGKKVSWLNREFLKQYKSHIKAEENDVDYSSIHTNYYDN
jgi:hypothetical protein